ncbi:MAG: hypothetical protein QM749_15180 [Aquabacterium sp.]
MGLLKILGRVALALVLLLALAWGAAIWQANRDVEPVSQAEREASFQRAVGWFKANEPGILQEGNSALWWMVQVAAQRTQDPYLLSLVQEALNRQYPADASASPWKRMMAPTADFTPPDPARVEQLEDYQRFFLHGLTCQPQPLGHGDTSRMLSENICRPLLFKVWPNDPVCSTHHAMGLALVKRAGCAVPPEFDALNQQVLDDIAFQTRYDILMRDAYIQHVLMLMWQRGPDAVKPVWLRRVLGEQQADGGWRGHKVYPYLPDALQPWGIHILLKKWWPSRFPKVVDPLDFHASAQGLLLMAMSLPERPAPQNGLPAN